MATKVNVPVYLKNVGKSFGYAFKDIAKDYTPILSSTLKDTKSTLTSAKMSMYEIKNNNISKTTKDFTSGENFLSNTLEDLKTGKWYNQERKDKSENDMFGLNFDLDFDFDEDWGDDDNDSSSLDTSSILEHDEINTRQIVSSMGQVGSDISKSLGYTSAKTAEYIVTNNNASSRALYDLNARGFNQVSSILMNMSGSLSCLIQLGKPLSDHMQNSSVFYTKTTQSLERITEDVNKMSTNLQVLVDRTAYMDKKNSAKEAKNSYGRFMSGGEFSLSSYIDIVKENVKEQSDSVKSMITMMEMMLGKNGKNTSLTEAIIKGTVEKLIPNITKDVAKQFDEALSASLGNGLMRAGKYTRNQGFLASMLADMLLPKENIKNQINPNSFEKGPVAWDGIARQSLTYVIPTYLAQMTALLAGVNDERDYQYYDFKSGKFTTKRLYQREKEIRNRAKARSVGGEFEELVLKSTGNKQLQKEVEEFFYQAMLNGGDFYNIKKGRNDASWRKKYGDISPETVELLLKVLEANNGKGPNKNRNAASKWESRNNSAIADNYRNMQNEELLGYSFENRFVDGTNNFIYRSALNNGGRKKGSGERNQSVYINAFNSSGNTYTERGWKQNEDGTYTVGTNNIVISAADFSAWLDAFESGDVKTTRKIENTKAMKEAKDKAKNMVRDAQSYIYKTKVGSKAIDIMSLLEKGRDIIQTPMYAVTMAMDTLNRGINNLFWGDGSEEGVIDRLKKKISSLWDKISDGFDRIFGTKSMRVLKDMGLDDKFVDIIRCVDKNGHIYYMGINAEGKKVKVSNKVGMTYEEQTRKKSLKESMGEEWGKIKQYLADKRTAARERREALSAELAKFKEMSGGLDNGNAAHGRQVTRSGFAVVSEGEMIIPSEFNPYYHGATNKSSQIANENRIRRNFFGSYANGGVVYNRINGDLYTDNKGGYYEYDSNTKKYNKIDIKNADGIKKVTSGYKSAIIGSGPVGAITEGAKTLAGGIMSFINGIAGKNDEKNNEKEKDRIFSKLKQSFVDAGDEKGALGIGAIAGAGVSLLTGAVVGPLAGAAIGAGVSLAIKSKAFQDILFGEGDPESEDYKKGLLGSIGAKLKDEENRKILGSTAIGGGAGLVAGTLMGSPILGMITGSTIGYVSKSQKAQEFLYGTEDNKTALGELRDKVKKSAPNVTAGALAGLVAGPFGVVGNLLVGSSLGYLTSTEDFRKFMFGDKESGDKGLVGKIHDKIMNPLDEIMHNLFNAVTGFTRKLGANIFGLVKTIGGLIKSGVKKASSKDNFLGKLIGGIGSLGGKIVDGTVGLAGGILDRVDTGLKKSNLNTGSSVYNKSLGRNETAEERLKTRGIIKNGGVTTRQDANGNTLYYKVNANGKEKLINENKYNKILKRNEKRGVWHEKWKYGKIDKSIAEMDENTINELTNKNNKESARLKLAEILEEKDVNKIKNSDLAQFISLLNDEKAGKYSSENKEKTKEENQNKAIDVINSEIPTITENTTKIVDLLSGTSENSSENEEVKTEDNNVRNLLNPIKSQDQEKSENSSENEVVTQTDMLGNIHQYQRNNQGELTEVNNDNETKKSRKIISKFTENINGIGKITGILTGIGGVLGFLKKGLLGDGDKKPGLLSKLFDGLFGKEGAFTGILSFFTGQKGGIGSIVKSIFSSGPSLLKNVLVDAGIFLLLGEAFKGAFDEIIPKITGLIGGPGAEDAFAEHSIEETRTYDVTTEDGSTVTAAKDSNGNFIDAEGNILDVSRVNSSRQNNVASFSDRLRENTVRGVLTGRGSVASTLIGRTTVGRATGSVVSTAVDAIGDSAKVASFADDILEGVIKFTSKLHNIPCLSFMADKIDDMGLALATKIQPILMSQTAQNIAKFASSAVVWIKIAYIVIDFTTGYEDARTTLGIVKEPTVGQRVLSGLLRAIKNFIPVIGSLIPDSLVIDVFCNYIAPALGIEPTELMNAREEAQQQVDAYNEATGNNYTVAEFTKSVMQDYTWTERIGNAASSTWEDTKTRFSNFGESVRENGIMETFRNMGADTINTFKESFEANGGGISGFISGIGDSFGNMLPGILGEIVRKNAEISSLAHKGDIAGLWKVSLDDFSGGGEDIEGTDLKTAVPSIFSRIIGQIPLIVTKLNSTPVGLFFLVFNKIREFLGPLKEKITNGIQNSSDNFANLIPYVHQGDVSALWANEMVDDEGNPLGGIYKGIDFVEKLVLTPSTAISWVGKKIKDLFISAKEKVVTGVENTAENMVTLYNFAKKGELSSLWSNEIKDDEENPLGGIYNGINFVQKVLLTPTGLFHFVGGKIKDKFNTVKDKVTNSFRRVIDNHVTLYNYAKNGDLNSLMSNEITDDTENPLGGVFNGINFVQKVLLTPTGLFYLVGNKIKDKFISIKDKVVNGFTTILDNYTNIANYAKEGDISSLWSNEIKDDEENPLGGIYNGINFVQKLSMTPTGLIFLVGNKIKEFLHADDIKSDASTFSNALKDFRDYAADGNLSSIWNKNVSFSNNNPVKSIFNVGITINKVLSSVVAIINKLIDPIGDLVEDIQEDVVDLGERVSDSFDHYVASPVANAWNSATSAISNAFGGSSGAGSGFVSQYDPRYQQYQVSGQQFAAKGCGPAVASMTASALGKNLSVGDAVRASNGYQTNNGVSIDYFQNALGSRGINTEIISGGSSEDMYRKIASGQKVILLGQDVTNTSKNNSPFGPNNHYVLATGLDRRGNIIVNDPESNGPRVYSPSILNNARYGIAGSNSGIRRAYKASKRYRNISGAGNPRNDEITQQIWAYLIALGMTEEVAAGIMGNMEQESGCRPDVNQNGGGAYGLCQWDGGRKNALKQLPNYQNLNVQLDFLASELPSQYWSKSGTINDVDGNTYSYQSMTYDEFKNLKDVITATIKFEAAFERAGRPRMSNRINYAKAYYEMFTGQTFNTNSNIGSTSLLSSIVSKFRNNSARRNRRSSNSSSSGGIMGILNTITSAFTNAFNGNNNDETNGEFNAVARYGRTNNVTSNSFSDNTENINIGTSTTYNPATPNFSSKSPIEWMRSILGQIEYDMQGPRDPDQGSADCSSTVRWAIKKAGGPDIGSYTLSQLDSPNLNTVWDGNGAYAPDISESLKPNDVIFFSRPNSSFTEGRKYRVGHVGLYSGEGKFIDHSSGMGPREKTLSFGQSGKIVKVGRIKNLDTSTNNSVSTVTSTLTSNSIIGHNNLGSLRTTNTSNTTTNEPVVVTPANTSNRNSGLHSSLPSLSIGGSSGILLASKAGSIKPGVPTFRDNRTGRLLPVRVSGGESNIASLTNTMLHSVKANVTNRAKSGGVSAELVAQLLQSITNILNNIADNTAPVAKIYNALAAYISAGGGQASTDKVTVIKKPETPSSSGSNEIDSNIVALAGVLAELAKG